MLNRLKKEKFLKTYKNVKRSVFDFERIARLFLHKDKSTAHQVISYSTLQDLDFEELFMYVDRTSSKIGQQYLYYLMRTIPKDEKRSEIQEKIIRYMDEHPKEKEATVLELRRLNNPAAYYLYVLGYNENIKRPKWFWVIPLLSALSVSFCILSFIFSVFILPLIPIIVVNFILHYWNKMNVLTYSNSIPQLLILRQVANTMLRLGVILEDYDQVMESNRVIKKISKSAIIFKTESKLNNELAQAFDALLDLIRASFLIEPILIFRIIKTLESHKTEIKKVFTAVAQIDAAISVSSFRESLPYHVVPEISENKKSFYGEEVFHPLIVKPVSNNIDLTDGKSVLISGSNMSGKTTFIRTIGINSILAQTINTACAKKFVLPRLKVLSAITINDNLLDDTSYYYQEVKRIKKMIVESESEDQNLFLLDELFKGTNTIERVSSAKAVLSYLCQNSNLVLVSTHDIELIDLLGQDYKYFHFEEFVKDGQLSFDYKLKKGKLSTTNAIKILEINGFPRQITEEAKELAKRIKEFKQ